MSRTVEQQRVWRAKWKAENPEKYEAMKQREAARMRAKTAARRAAKPPKAEPVPKFVMGSPGSNGWRLVLQESDRGEVCKIWIRGCVARFERVMRAATGATSVSTYANLFDFSGRRFKTVAEAERA